MSRNDEKYYADITTSENNIIITTGDRPVISTFQSYVEIYLPKEYNGSLSISTNNGEIQTSESYKLNTVNIQTDNGAVAIENIAAGTIDNQTSNGAVDLKNVAAQVGIETENGKIHIENGIGLGVFDTSSGKMEIQYSDITGDIEARSESGKIQISIPQSLSFQLSATTNSGEISTSFADVLTSSEKSANGTIGNTAEIAIKLSTTSGDIQVDYQ